MCLSIPSRIKEIKKNANTAIVDTMGINREVSLDLMDVNELAIGDYVLIHIGFVMNKIDEDDAMESLKIYEEILAKMDEEERAQALEN